MVQEDKELLLKDLCARLPYGVKCINIRWPRDGHVEISNIDTNSQKVQIFEDWCDISDCKPYLRPISNMTFGEWEEMTALIYPHGRVNRNPDNKNELLLWLSAEGNDMPIILMDNVFSWLNSHHFDYRGLIEKGLALVAPKGMY